MRERAREERREKRERKGERESPCLGKREKMPHSYIIAVV